MTRNRNIGKSHLVPYTPLATVQHRFKRFEAGFEFFALTVYPRFAALCLIVKAHLVKRCTNRVHAAVRQGFAPPHFSPGLEVFRD
jgi:hypothetical protein